MNIRKLGLLLLAVFTGPFFWLTAGSMVSNRQWKSLKEELKDR